MTGYGGLRLEFGTVGAGIAEDIASVFDDRDLHAEADAEVGNLVFAGITGGLNFALDAAAAKATGDQNAVDIGPAGFPATFSIRNNRRLRSI